jgi:hypothetical protein
MGFLFLGLLVQITAAVTCHTINAMKSNYVKELLCLFAFLALNAFFLYVILFFAKFISLISAIPHLKLIAIICLASLVVSYLVHRKFRHKEENTFILILTFPYRFSGILLTVGFPFIMLQIHILLFLVVCLGFPWLLIVIYQYFRGIVIDDAFKTYIILTSAVISSTIFQKQIRFVAKKFSPVGFGHSKTLKLYKIEELSDYLFTENNVRTVIYFFFFIILVLINAFNLRGIGFYNTLEVDAAVLQSFATFLAFDRIISILKVSEFKPSEMITKMLNAIREKMKNDSANDK